MLKLISFSGLPGVGKSTIAKALARDISAVYIRVDSIEAALKVSALGVPDAEDAGYLAAANIAKDNLALGQNVVADTVNPVSETRALWAQVAADCSAMLVNVEIVCSDENEHRRRVETRKSEIRGLVYPNWSEIEQRLYQKWAQDRLILDSGSRRVNESVSRIIDYMNAMD
ncbi:AAA family ATPase [Hoeflea sp. WL0058]|uniref:AAA family ATPase n=1 Tax=Flavimaribacter sediminis TaxID=2865987 RepID=A0AAE2ZUT1_9HYPH|nr:AAA family ATPase [Flavimaribacter sediminis]MBW8640037.1 AAA family ATPase [Flavimaribacter sediminis]